MELYKLPEDMQDSIEYFRGIDYLSLYGKLDLIVDESGDDPLSRYHSIKVLKHFNDFDDQIDDENFMKCLLGHYQLI